MGVEAGVQKAFAEASLQRSSSQRSMSSIGLSSMANASSPALSSMGGGMGKRSSTRSRSSLSLDKIGEGQPMHRNTSHDSLMSALSIDNSSENKKKAKKKK